MTFQCPDCGRYAEVIKKGHYTQGSATYVKLTYVCKQCGGGEHLVGEALGG